MSAVETKPSEIVKRPIGMGSRGLQLTTLDDAFRFAQYVVSSGLAPKGITRPEQALIAMQAGAELGFSPMRSLSAITVINGRTGVMGDAALAKIHESNVCSRPPVITVEGDGDERHGVARFQRKDMPSPVEITFSVAEAKKAHLWGKTGPWSEYPDDMLGWRAVGRMCKRYFGDVTMGLVVAEELQDYPREDLELAPPAEPDPLLTGAHTVELKTDAVEAEIIEEKQSGAEPDAQSSAFPASTTDGAPSADEAATIKAIDKLEGQIVSAESLDELTKVWGNAAPVLLRVSAAERSRLEKLLAQNASNFGAPKPQPVNEKRATSRR